MANNATSVGAVALDMRLNSSGLTAAVNAAAQQAGAQLSAAMRQSLQSCESTMARIGQDISQTMQAATSSISDSTRQISQAITSSTQNIGAVTAQATQGLSNVDRGAASASQTIGTTLMSSVKKLGAAVGVAFSVRQIVRFTKSCVEAAAQVKALNAQITQTFKTLEGDARNAIAAVAAESGILDTRLQGLGSQMYAFAKASGMESTTALNMMKEALQVTADSAAFYDKSLEDVGESLRSFLKGNYANDAALGVSCTQATRNAAANKLYGKSFKELSEAQKQLTLLQMVKDANELSGAMGQAAREADGWENVTGNLKESWKQLTAAIGKPLLQALIPVIKNITTSLQTLTQAANTATAAFADLFGWDLSAAQGTGDAIVDIAKDVEEAEEDAQKEIEKTAQKAKGSLAGFDKLNVLSQSEESDTDEDEAAKNSVVEKSAQQAQTAVENLDESVDSLNFDGVREKLQAVYNFIKPLVDGVKGFISEISESVNTWWENSGSQAFDKLKEAFIGVKNVVVDIWNSLLKPFFTYIGESFGAFWEDHLKPLWTGILEFISSLMEAIAAIWTGFLEPLYDTFIKRIMVGVLGALKSLWDMVMDVFGIVVDCIKNVLRFAQGLLQFITGVFTGDLDKAFDGINNMFSALVNTIWVLFKGAMNLVIDALNTVWSALYGVLKSIVDGVGDFVGAIGDMLGKSWGFSMPDEVPRIPRLAQGGAAYAPTIAVIGDNPNARSDPEVVAPLSKLNGMIGENGGASDEMIAQLISVQREILAELKRISGKEFVGEVDKKVLFKAIVAESNNYKRMHGRSALA